MDEYTKIQIRTLFNNILPLHGRRKDSKQRSFLIDCITQSGYIKEKESIPDIFEEVEYSEVGAPEEILENKYRFSRTFFNPTQQFNRLAELQKYGIDPEESALNKVADTFDTALNIIKVNDPEYIKNIAINMYFNILLYYNSGNPLNILSNKTSIKRGYIALSLFYALKFNKIIISKEYLISLFNDISLSDLPVADKNIHRIFEKSPGYSFIYTISYDLCGITLDPSLTQQIHNLLDKLKTKTGISKKTIAAVVYHVCKINKKKLTLQQIATNCGLSASTISKAYTEITSFL
jgi:hypothetical protein